MLILTRRVGETVVIDEKINVTVLSVKGTQVRIGIDADKDVLIRREELEPREAPVGRIDRTKEPRRS